MAHIIVPATIVLHLGAVLDTTIRGGLGTVGGVAVPVIGLAFSPHVEVNISAVGPDEASVKAIALVAARTMAAAAFRMSVMQANPEVCICQVVDEFMISLAVHGSEVATFAHAHKLGVVERQRSWLKFERVRIMFVSRIYMLTAICRIFAIINIPGHLLAPCCDVNLDRDLLNALIGADCRSSGDIGIPTRIAVDAGSRWVLIIVGLSKIAQITHGCSR